MRMGKVIAIANQKGALEKRLQQVDCMHDKFASLYQQMSKFEFGLKSTKNKTIQKI